MKAALAALLAFPLSLLPARAQDITWSVPEDGGTPHDLQRIEQKAPKEFHIRASFEDGGQSVLRHAVSRVDLLCHNAGTAPVTVTLHLDLSGDGQRTDYDTKPESGMKLRDFAFIQPPGGEWTQIDGSTDRWIATVKFQAAPGDTKFGLSPWYTYADYLRFINGLPAHPHLKKEMIGKSDGGREHWELTVTDPSVPREKKRVIFWHGREHCYETFASYAMEGAIGFLLSDEAAEFRRHYVIVLHPMTNVDGVAQGFEYRGSYDLPDPHKTATGKLTFAAVDRLKPDFAVTWHNWIMPRDRNVVFYTDGDQGKPTSRAWLRFTQLFPTLRMAGHRWKDETTPEKYNWEGRPMTNDFNLHQYAMKKYGTRIWGWEMPWWNFTTGEVRQMGASFGRAFLRTIDEIRDGTTPAEVTLPVAEVPRWELHEFTAQGRAHVDNPFREAALVGEFTAPSGRTVVADGFYDGGDTWRLRFAPDEEGEWKFLLRGEGVEILQRGTLRCTPPRGHGPIRIHPENPFAFATADGTAFFPMGDTCYGLFDDTPITPALREQYLRTRREQQFNFIRFTIGHSEAHAAADPENYWAWGGTPRHPDLDRFNPKFFQHFDDLMRQLRASGMNAEMILLNFYRRPYTDTAAWTPAREHQWLRYLLARYGAFDNVFLWTLANEYETHPDGKYRLDVPGDIEWVKSTASFIKANDPYHHLVTVHPVISASRKGESPRAGFDPPWRIGEFFGPGPEIDVLSQQTGQMGEGTAWDETQHCWTGDSATLTASIAADHQYHKPVLNSENGYEYLRDGPSEKRQVHHTDKVRRSSWRIVCAGGWFAAGFNGTIGHSDAWNRIDPAGHYTFLVKDEGAAAQLKSLHDFFTALPFARLKPFTALTGDAIALADPGQTYVVYLPHGDECSFDLPAGNFKARWFNPRTGKFEGDPATKTGGRQTFHAPDANDWALLLR